LPPVPQERIVNLAGKARILLNWSDNKVKFWKIEEINESATDNEDRIEKRYLLEMDFNVQTQGKTKISNIRTKRIFPRLQSRRTESTSS
jgi:hypothetical protein